jgi:hypothetical protein
MNKMKCCEYDYWGRLSFLGTKSYKHSEEKTLLRACTKIYFQVVSYIAGANPIKLLKAIIYEFW